MLSLKDLDGIESIAIDYFLSGSFDMERARIQAAYDYGRRVKPLANEELDKIGYFVWTLHTIDGYTVTACFKPRGVDENHDDETIGKFFNDADAWNACQKHHESIILGALE